MLYGAVGQHAKALEYQTRALDIRREALGDRHPNVVGSCIDVLVTLRALGRRRELFQLAKEWVERIPPSAPRYRELVAAYDDSRPPGFRALGSSTPPASRGGRGGKTGKKKRR